jgi:hypothetical protein
MVFMQARAYDGYFEKGRFIPFEAANIPDRRKARVTVYDEVIPDEIGRKLAELDDIIALAHIADDEEMPTVERVSLAREVAL